jgi:hexosaminidase
MSRFYFLNLVLVCSFLLILGCSQPVSYPQNTFSFLPSVAEQYFKGEDSVIDVNTLKFAYSPTGDVLPQLYGMTKQIQGVDRAENAQLEFSIQEDKSQSPESYRLEITNEKIIIQAQSQAGLFYGFITLNQLIEDAIAQDTPLPLLEINDAPKIAFRPIQIDVKHHLEKKSYYYDLLDELAQLKINGIILEIEDKLQYKRRSEVGSADALSIDEWRAISDYAIARNIKISPLVQGLGHASFVLKHEKNKHLRDDPASDWAFNPLDPETYEVQFDLYLDAMEAFPHGKYLHVGGDEVQTTGRESGKSALELNLIWLNKVTDFAAEHDRIPIFWDDMPLKQAGLMRPIYDAKMPKVTVDSIWQANEPKLNRFIEQFPKNCVYMRWNYHMAESYGNGKAMDWFSSNGFQVMGATAGQTRWTLMPQRESNIDQIRIFAEQSINRNYNGLLLTLWDDDSPHFELYKRGINAFAEFSWGGLKRSKEEFKKAYRHRKFGSRFQSEDYAFIDALDKPVGVWTNLLVEEGIHRNSLNQRENPIEEHIIDLPDFDNKGAWSEKYAGRLAKLEAQRKIVEKVQNTLQQIQTEGTKAGYNLKVYNQVGNLVDYNFRLMQTLNAFDIAQNDTEKANALETLNEMKAEFNQVRAKFEEVYSQTRILNKPEGYILDQDHHRHPANQSVNFDWQFTSELMLLQKIDNHFKTRSVLMEGTKTQME